MKRSVLFIAILFLSTGVFAQASGSKYGPKTKAEMIGFHYNALDFITPVTWKDNAAPRRVARPGDMDYGFSLSYWRGIKPKIDLCVKFNGNMHDYAGDRGESTTKTETGLELEPSINARALDNDNFFSPFLTAGLGLGLYTGEFGAYLPVGTGLQFNFSGNTMMMLQANYRLSLSEEILDDQLVYSLGFIVKLKQED